VDAEKRNRLSYRVINHLAGARTPAKVPSPANPSISVGPGQGLLLADTCPQATSGGASASLPSADEGGRGPNSRLRLTAKVGPRPSGSATRREGALIFRRRGSFPPLSLPADNNSLMSRTWYARRCCPRDIQLSARGRRAIQPVLQLQSCNPAKFVSVISDQGEARLQRLSGDQQIVGTNGCAGLL